MKKIIISSTFILVILIVCSLFKVSNKEVVFGDYILTPLDSENNKYETSFSNNNLTSELLLEYLDYNAMNLKNNQKINDLIKKSKKIYISIGMNDLLEYVSLVDNKLVYSPTLINEKIALLEYNVHEIMTSILAIKEVEIYYFSLYYLNDEDFDYFIEDYNSDIKDILEGLKVNYIETNDLISVKNYSYSLNEQKIIYEYIKTKI